MSLLVEFRGDQRLKHLLHDVNFLGRAPGNSIQFIDPLASRYHAEIRKQPDGRFEISDLGSRHGTYVAGVAVEKHLLAPQDEIILGATRFRFEQEALLEGEGKRWHERLTCVYPVRLLLEERSYDTRAVDLSVGGVRIDLDEPIPAGTAVRLSIGFPGRTRRFRVNGRVTSNPSSQRGLGVAFVFDTPGQETVVASEVARLLKK
ncbi:MAG: FHA domain-containing protein [Deltaproteobacteria bacterium]|nr:FHA domain-containing protein [Deltaproteobacteria bacterium]